MPFCLTWSEILWPIDWFRNQTSRSKKGCCSPKPSNSGDQEKCPSSIGNLLLLQRKCPEVCHDSETPHRFNGENVPNKVPWGPREQLALDELKSALIQATEQRLHIINMELPFHILVDASDHTVGGVLLQPDLEGWENPIAFFSLKFSDTQRRWATVEKEAFAALSALKKYRQCVFGAKVIVFSDHNPLTFSQNLHLEVLSLCDGH